jgi:ribosome-associated toxin RatA of RatAB toxin-antitoxin module
MLLKAFLPLATKRHVERRIVPGISAQRLFEVVLDVNAYQTFLPYCRHSQIDKQLAADAFRATLTVGIPPVLVETYTSHVAYHRRPSKTPCENAAPTTASTDDNNEDHPVFTVTTRSVESHYIESLWSRWKLQDVRPTKNTAGEATNDVSTVPATSATSTGGSNSPSDPSNEACRVEFEVEMQVRDPIIAAALDQLLPKVAVQQVDAFIQRSKTTTTGRKQQ